MRAQFRDMEPDADIRDETDRYSGARGAMRGVQAPDLPPDVERQESRLQAFEEGYAAGREDGNVLAFGVLCMWLSLGVVVGAGYRWAWDWMLSR